ncbi:MotA/TolQ/ExbB proton channel family protein [Stenotrophobium rhamnosiphilum]|uniref:MotA/TolQ/ExbB proton channel family protein n=1 Tax=Stenotrophobium rhamnosiphilum TaxID=2029166 RepID=A0A2T5MHZ9_9GAMM|nr:MotA/TolQ/ExbB proton channel family protein [Stenotrophobium rhamnosiphilum]PTU32217.1 MotA/TolQ/ExbB proton channel family protein [Stenotrophobium rhamnosiphilum]
MKKLFIIAALSFSAVAQAAPQGLDELLKQVQQGSQASAKMNADREARFLRDKNEQAAMLQKAEADLATANARISRVKGRYDASQAEIKALKEKLQTRVGDTGQMYASVRQAAGDFRGAAAGSLVTAQYPERIELLEDLMKGTELPSVAKLEKFWFLLQQEMTEGGKVARFSAEIVDEDGARAKADVIRIGVFDAFADGQYLAMQTDGSLSVLPRQPGHGATGLAKSFAKSDDPIEPIIVDPSHGTLLALESARPTIGERLHMGGFVGYVIIFIGLVGAAIAAYQLTFLIKVGRLIHIQLANLRQPNLDNPLGRVLACLTDEISADPEVVELHVSEAVLRETPKIERFQGLIRLIVAAGPLLGLLGTVIGMIETFQVITEVGAGDPKVMAGGISQAMIATVLGLGIAIPLLFVNTLLMSRSRALVQILDEQSAGMLAQRMETARAANAH